MQRFEFARRRHALGAPFVLAACLLSIVGVRGVCAEPQQDAQQATAVARVLIVTGEEYHQWKKTAPVLQELLAQDKRLDVAMHDDLTTLDTVELEQYDVVVMHFKNYDPKVPGRKAFDRLAAFVDGGGGLVLVHFACGAFEEFKDDFEHVAGRVWMGLKHGLKGRHQHDPYGKFTVKIEDANHPITRGLGDFETIDELYTCLVGNTPIEVLATATSKVDGKIYPMAFVLKYGQGRVFHCVLGHDVRSLEVPKAGELYRRGCAWTATLPPVAEGLDTPGE